MLLRPPRCAAGGVGDAMRPASRAARALLRQHGAAREAAQPAATAFCALGVESPLARNASRVCGTLRMLSTVARPLWLPGRYSRPGMRSQLPAVAASLDAEDDEPPPFTEEDCKFWRRAMDRVTLPSAHGMLQYLDPTDPLGVDSERKGVNGEGLYGFMKREKLKHKRKVLLVRVGEFYETMGFDAALLVQFAGLNPMGLRPYKAGTPIANLRRALDALLHQGFSVAVYEEAPQERKYGQKTAYKTRYLAGIVTPSSPSYVHGMAKENSLDPEAFYASAPPTLGVASFSNGFMLVEVHPETRQYSVLEGLPEQALVARLWNAPTAPLYLHASVNSLPGYSRAGTVGSNRARREGSALAVELAGRLGGERLTYDGHPVDALLDAVRQDLRVALPDAVEFKPNDPRLVAGAPRPLFLTAAMSLGVVHSTGVPDLLASLLPRTTPRAVADTLRSMLLSPPPEHVARSLLSAHSLLRECTEPLPTPPLIPAGKLSRLISERECSAHFLAETAALCSAISVLWSNERLRPIAEALLAPAQLATGSELKADLLVSDCEAASAVIHSVLSEAVFANARSSAAGVSPDVAREDWLGSAVGKNADDNGSSAEMGWESHWPKGDAPPPCTATPVEFLLANEEFRGRVRRERVKLPHEAAATAYDALESAAAALDAAISEDLVPFVESWCKARKTGRGGANDAVAIVHDPNNNAVRLKAPSRSTTDKWTAGLEKDKIDALLTPFDRFGRLDKSKSGRFSTQRVEAALEAYRRAAEAADAAVLKALRDAADELRPFLASLVGAAEVALYLRLATEHTREARQRGWCLPQLLPEGSPWRMRELTPPWMDRAGSSTVSNSFDCSGLFLLTGPNMAGKSTLGRAAGCAALLANCGLNVPAASAEVPRFLAYFVRMASADSPAEGLSHWGLDMKEAAALADGSAVGAGTCVVLDETCQGTEVAHATAMAGTLLEMLDTRGARGIFATHLHGVLSLPLSLENTTRMAMETTRNEAGVLQPTLRMIQGECTESLAFEVAADCGLPQQLLDRAAQLLLHALPAPSSQPAPPAPPVQPPVPLHQPSSAPPARQPPLGTRAPTLRDAAAVLKLQSAKLLGGEELPLTLMQLSGAGSVEPPPSTSNRSAVYMLRVLQVSGVVAFYVGESDDLVNRLRTHRRTHSEATLLEAAYVLVPSAGGAKSKAREVEASTINELRAAGYNLLSDKDGGNRSFGR